MQKQMKQTRTSSKKRLQQINQQQRNLSNQFRISNFYKEQRFDLQGLKQKIKQVRIKKSQSKGKELKSISYHPVKQKQKHDHQFQLPQMRKKRYLNTRQKDGSSQNNKKYQSLNKSRIDHYHQNQIHNHNYNYNSVSYQNPQTKIITAAKFNSNQIITDNQYQNQYQYNLNNIHYFQNSKHQQQKYGSRIRQSKYQISQKKSSRLQKDRQRNNQTNNNSYNNNKLQPINSIHLTTIPDEKVTIDKGQDLSKYEHQIQQLWSLYQLLTLIMQGVQKYPFKQQLAMIKYIQDICSDKFEFLLDLLQRLIQKKYHRTIIQSKLLENIAIVYLSIQLCHKKKIRNPYLVNFIGFCTSNVIFLIRMIHLCHDLTIQPSNNVIRIIDAIKTFQMDSYKAQIKSIKQLVLRMQHNNQIINILQTKIGNNHTKEYQQCITQFLKHIDRNQKPLYQYGHYIFQFLAYYLNKENLVGILPYVEIAPAPYLSFTYPQTLIIQPWGVLFYQKGNNLYIRAHAELFINQLSKNCNIVFWTDLMPNQGDPLLSLLPSGKDIHHLYKYHCKYEKDNYVKILWRAGCLPQNSIIIDRTYQNCPYDKQMAIEMSWKGQKKDTKLLTLLELLIPLFNNGHTLKKQMEGLRANLKLLLKAKRATNINSRMTNHQHRKNIRSDSKTSNEYQKQDRAQ